MYVRGSVVFEENEIEKTENEMDLCSTEIWMKQLKTNLLFEKIYITQTTTKNLIGNGSYEHFS